MRQRGRPSAVALAVRASALDVTERQRPPHDLTDEEVEVWVAVVNSEAADWFSPSTAPILAQYCRHVVAARKVAELIERVTSDPDLSVRDYDRLLHMQDRESLVMTTLATKMRITQQSITNHRGNKKTSTLTLRPWESKTQVSNPS